MEEKKLTRILSIKAIEERKARYFNPFLGDVNNYSLMANKLLGKVYDTELQSRNGY